MSSNEPQKLFSTLIASKPPRQRRGIWIGVAIAHVVLIAILWVTGAGRALHDQVIEIVTPFVVIEDEPVPVPIPEIAPAPPKPVERREVPKKDQKKAQAPAAPQADPAPQPPTGPPISGDPLLPPGQPTGNAPSGNARSLAERLRGGGGESAQLLAPIGPAAPAVGVEAARERLATTLRVYNDSLAAEAAANKRASDWTRTDANGNKWGISPGKIHLGSITIPLNNNGEDLFRAPPARREEAAKRLREWREIEIAAARAEIKDSFEERVKEIRKRKEAERAKKKPVT